MDNIRGLFFGEPGQSSALLPVSEQAVPRWLLEAGTQGFLGQFLDCLAAGCKSREQVFRHTQGDRCHAVLTLSITQQVYASSTTASECLYRFGIWRFSPDDSFPKFTTFLVRESRLS